MVVQWVKDTLGPEQLSDIEGRLDKAIEHALYAQRDAIQKQLNDKSAQFEALRVQSEKDHEQDKVALGAAEAASSSSKNITGRRR